jgi:hypothetical protein
MSLIVPELPRLIVPQEQFSDVRWRLNNLYCCTNPKGQLLDFRTNWAQQRFLEAMWYLNLILKARQLGFTTFIQLFMLDACVFNSNIRCGVMAHTLDDAKIIFRDKVKFPYEQLPDQLRTAVPPTGNSAAELLLANNSSIRVGTSLRGGTLQYLHISEYGKICARNPEKAREVRTGALNTLAAGQIGFIESTAEGQDGHFFELTQEAQEQQRRGKPLGLLDWKFHFYPWWQEPAYTLDPEGVEIPPALVRYFDQLAELHGIHLSDRQRAWYAAKHKTQGSDMKREFPGTPMEAFEAAVEGAYYGDLLAQADEDKRITKVPWDPSLPVHICWDLGLDEAVAIWFFQRVGLAWHFIDYLGVTGRDDIARALPWFAKELDRKPYRYGDCILPHDGNTRDQGTGLSRKDTLQGLGLRRIRVMPARDKETSINGVRQTLPKCYFDAEKTGPGLKALRSYRRRWDEARGSWANEPYHDWASHPADSIAEGCAADPQNDDLFSKKLKYDNTGIR